MGKRTALIIVFAIIAGPAMAQGSYGGIAYSPDSDNTAAVADKASQQEAENAAIKSCREETKSAPDSCQSALWFKDACGALARDTKLSSWGTGWGDTQKIAAGWAIKICQQHGGKDCKLSVAICSPGGAATIPNDN